MHLPPPQLNVDFPIAYPSKTAGELSLPAPFSEARHPVPGYSGKCVSFCRGRQGITSLDHPHGKPPKLHSGEAV